jgi:hypothetical protein
MKNLKSFEVPDVVEFRLSTWLADWCPNITEMRCRSLQIVNEYAVALQRKGMKVHLKTINLTTPDVLDADLLVRILLISPQIEVSSSSVSLINTFHKFDHYLKNNPSYNTLLRERLTRLTISSTMHLRALNLATFSKLVSLEILTNVDREMITPAFSKMNHLKELTIKTEIENFDLLAASPMELEKLHFTDTQASARADPFHLWNFLKTRCNKIQELTIMCRKTRGWSRGNDEFLLKTLHESCPNLHSIHIHNFGAIRLEYCSVTKKLLISRYNQPTLDVVFYLFPRVQFFELECDLRDFTRGWSKQLQEFANKRRNKVFKGTFKLNVGETVSRVQDGVNLDITVIT